MGSSFSDHYIERTAATVLALSKVLEGAAAGFSLFMLLRVLAPIMGGLSKGVMDVNRMLQIIVSEYGLPDNFFDSYSDIMIGSFALPAIIYGVILLLIIIALLLVVIETVALLALRFARAGSGLVKVIHKVYMVVCILHLLMFVYSVFNYIRNRPALIEAVHGSRAAVLSLEITLVIGGIIWLIEILLHLCYHKDIAMAMETVGNEINTGMQSDFKRTHLSGISFLFGLPYVALILACAVGLSNGNLVLTERIGNTGLPNWTMVVVIVILMLKQYAVCFCYRNMKLCRHN